MKSMTQIYIVTAVISTATIILYVLAFAFNHKEAVNEPDYTLELTKEYTIIINGDTIELDELEEYIINNNL